MPEPHLVRLCDFGTDLLTRDQGAAVRHELEAEVLALAPGERLRIDFTDVAAITPSFVDESLGRLLLNIGERRFRSAVKLETTNESIRRLVSRVLAHRAHEARSVKG